MRECEPPELTVYLMRHGETQATLERRYEGRGDGDLARIGVEQAADAAVALAAAGVRAVYSSPLRRALRTARIIAERCGTSPIVLEGLAEVDFGDWDGLTFDEIQRRDPHLLEQWLADPLGTRPPGGETLAGMWERVHQCLEDIIEEQRTRPRSGVERAVAIVTHGGPIRALISYCERCDLGGIWNISVRPGEFRVLRPRE